MNNKEYDYLRIAKGMEVCECEHAALMHSWWTDLDISLEIPLTYWQCDVTNCRCELFKIDNLRFLEKKYEDSLHG